MAGDFPADRLPLSVDEAGRLLRDGSVTVEALARGYLTCVERRQPELNALITVMSSTALERARGLDIELRSGHDRGPLHGIPVVYKDNIDVRGAPTTVGSEVFRHRVPKADADIVGRLEEAGVILLGKANLSEFCSGSSGKNIHFGSVKNPWDLERSPGGSSSGTASAVASGMSLAGIGTDTGGSIRQPASRCGILGLRPTYGRISINGIWPRAQSLDAVGPMARNVRDAALIMEALVTRNAYDPASPSGSSGEFTASLDGGVRGLRLGVIEGFSLKDIDPDVGESVYAALDTFAHLGAKIVPVKIPPLVGDLDYKALFDNALLYEFHKSLKPYFEARQPEVFGVEVQADFERGALVTRQAYETIMERRPAFAAQVRLAFSEVDALVTPTVPNVTPLQSADAEVWACGRRFALPFSFAGLPSVSLPAGTAGGMPVGIQIVGDAFGEPLLLRVSAAFERATELNGYLSPYHCHASCLGAAARR